MKHMLDTPRPMPTISAAESRRLELHADIDAFLARGGSIKHVDITARGWEETTGLQYYIEKTGRVSFAIAQEMKHAPKAAPRRKKGLMSADERKAKRKADSLARTSQPCKVVWDGKECGSMKYSKGQCLGCKSVKAKMRRQKLKESAK